MANSVDPDEMAQNEPSHQDLHCLCKCQVCSAEIKRTLKVSFNSLHAG